MNKIKYKRIAVFGDNVGIPISLKYIPKKYIKCVVISSIRPKYFDELKKIVKKNNLKLLIQPKYKSLEYNDFIKQFNNYNIDLIFCNSYSMIIRDEILKSVNYNAINVHWALLPKNRGPNPVQWAIIKGEPYTGVTIHYMNNDLDSGDIIFQIKIKINFQDTWVSVSNKCRKMAEKLIKQQISFILTGNNKRYSQNNDDATVNFRLTPEYPKIDFEKMSDIEIYNLIRAQIAPLKGAYIKKDGNNEYFNSFMDFNKVKKLRNKYDKKNNSHSSA